MRILFMERWTSDPRGGTESIKTLFEEVSKEHETKFIWRGNRKTEEGEEAAKLYSNSISPYVPLEVEKLLLFLEPQLTGLYERIDEFDPDLIVTQSESSYIAVKYAQENDCRSCVFLRAWELLYASEKTHGGNMIVSKIANSAIRPLNKRLADYCLENADILVANSKYTAGVYEDYIERDPEVVYPFVDLEKYRTEPGEKILHVNPSKDKGIDLTLDVAEGMPEEHFIIAGNPSSEIAERIEGLENVECLGYVEDMKEAYSQTKIALVPSKWDEPFGRIPIEAGASGIPTVASDRGGLQESVGEKALLALNQKPESYIEKIRQVDESYEEYSGKAKKNAEEKKIDHQINRFLNLIS
ncbi:MAG: glycosyltransferase [Nanohaloarchaea archaeon]|nr:glycosyltransferase [Candidatus Nanohaloarchaea archaeon]